MQQGGLSRAVRAHDAENPALLHGDVHLAAEPAATDCSPYPQCHRVTIQRPRNEPMTATETTIITNETASADG